MKWLTEKKWLFLAVCTATGFTADWITKFWAEKTLTLGQPVDVIGVHLQFLLLYNRGALWGIDPQRWIAGFPTRIFFLFFSMVAVALLLVYYRFAAKENGWVRLGLALVLPGALGNLFDRVAQGGRGVVDFIKIGISETVYWPVFNVADIFITAGIIALMIGMVRDEFQARKKEKAAAS